MKKELGITWVVCAIAVFVIAAVALFSGADDGDPIYLVTCQNGTWIHEIVVRGDGAYLYPEMQRVKRAGPDCIWVETGERHYGE